MQPGALPFRLAPERRIVQLSAFQARTEIGWFGFLGAFQEPGEAVITFAAIPEGARGGGGTQAINGGVIAAGFDAAFVLAGLGHYDSEVVVTLELSVQFLSLARTAAPLAWRAQVLRSARHFAFAHASLGPAADRQASPFATATAMVAPAGARG